jgi:hypothetical protein
MKPLTVVREHKVPVLVEFDLGGLVIGFRQAERESYRMGATETHVPAKVWADMMRTTRAIFRPAKRNAGQVTKGGSL